MPINVGLLVPDAWCAQPRGTLLQSHDAGPPALVPVLVPGRVPFPPAEGGSAPVVLLWSLGWCLVPLARPRSQRGRIPPTGRMPGYGSPSPGFKAPPSCAGVGSSPGPPPDPSRCKEHMALPTSDTGPSLGPFHASMLNARALPSNILGPAEVDKLKKVLDPTS